jgi:hypothetical protein
MGQSWRVSLYAHRNAFGSALRLAHPDLTSENHEDGTATLVEPRCHTFESVQHCQTMFLTQTEATLETTPMALPTSGHTAYPVIPAYPDPAPHRQRYQAKHPAGTHRRSLDNQPFSAWPERLNT